MVDISAEQQRNAGIGHPLDRTGAGSKWFMPLLAVVILTGLGYIAYALGRDLTSAAAVPWILLGLALLIALGFEFVNGFHDTANAVASRTGSFTRSRRPGARRRSGSVDF
jgi:PiT family inorganic phosphate transporter